MTNVRPSTPADDGPIHELCCEAFGGEDEARLVTLLAEQGFARLSLVAENEGQVIGFIVFSELSIEREGKSIPGLALAPLAVRRAHQGRGVGSMLVDHGLKACREIAHSIVIVLGHPAYYSRFGFSIASAQALQSKYSGPSFMALALTPGALDGIAGLVKYPPPFDIF